MQALQPAESFYLTTISLSQGRTTELSAWRNTAPSTKEESHLGSLLCLDNKPKHPRKQTGICLQSPEQVARPAGKPKRNIGSGTRSPHGSTREYDINCPISHPKRSIRRGTTMPPLKEPPFESRLRTLPSTSESDSPLRNPEPTTASLLPIPTRGSAPSPIISPMRHDANIHDPLRAPLHCCSQPRPDLHRGTRGFSPSTNSPAPSPDHGRVGRRWRSVAVEDGGGRWRWRRQQRRVGGGGEEDPHFGIPFPVGVVGQPGK